MKHNELYIRLLKIFDIGYITSFYFLIGLLCAKVLDTLYGDFNKEEEKKKELLQTYVELVGMMWLSGIVIYIVRNLAEFIPSPFDHLYGFEHKRVKELGNAAAFTFTFLYFQATLKSKLQYLYDLKIV